MGEHNNLAEISKVYNEQGAEDIDSIPDNHNINENDISSMNIIIET